MIIGTATELRALGQSLLEVNDEASDLSFQKWPERVAQIAIDTRDNFLVSFHMDTAAGDQPSTNFP
jgi:hypothetical protein